MQANIRKHIIISEIEAASLIDDGMTISIGGAITSSKPMAIIRQIIKRGIKNLTVVSGSVAGLEVDLLIGAGCVKKLIAAYIGAERLAPIGPFFQWAVMQNEINYWECDEGHFYMALQAAALGIPSFPWRGGVGTSYPEVNPELKLYNDPHTGDPLIAVPAIRPDVAILHAAHSDPYGNVQHVGPGWGDRAHHRAAAKTIVEVERIISNEEVRRDPHKTSVCGADAIVCAAYGAHPFASPGYYLHDEDHIKAYVKAVRAYTHEDDKAPFEGYLDKYVMSPETHIGYLEKIGIRRLVSLLAY